MIEISLIVLTLIVVVNLFLTLAIIRHLNSPSARATTNAPALNSLQKGEKVPDFTVEALNGEKVSLANYLGRDTVFVFVEPNCQPCRELIPTLKTIGPGARRSGVELVLVVLSTLEKAHQFVNEFKIDLPTVAVPEGSSIRKDYKVNGTPAFSFFDEGGVVKVAGFLGNEWLSLTNQWKMAG